MSTQTDMTVRKTVLVDFPVEEAFSLFTDGIGEWWPLHTHAYDTEESVTAAFVGGRLVERRRDGSEAEWGRVLAWEPPHRLLVSWTITEPATEVEVRFEPEGPGTRVHLEHRGWEALGDSERRASYGGGWEKVLGAFQQAASK